mgnify:CR=1 FL=1|jgi:hypothetical protein
MMQPDEPMKINFMQELYLRADRKVSRGDLRSSWGTWSSWSNSRGDEAVEEIQVARHKDDQVQLLRFERDAFVT